MITINLSSSALSHSGCLLDFKYTVIDGLKEHAPSSNIVYGEAVHAYIDMMFKTNGHIPTAMQAAIRKFNQPKVSKTKSPHLDDQRHMISVAFGVWERWIMEDRDFSLLMLDLECWNCGGKGMVLGQEFSEGSTCPWCKGAGHYVRPATELTFSFPYYKDEFITVNLEGTIDSIGKIKNGIVAIRDWKTTSTWDKKSFFFPYRMSKQLRFYTLALKLMSKCYPESQLGKLSAGTVGTLIDAIFIKPDSNDSSCERSEVFVFDDSDINAFESLLIDFIKRLSSQVAQNLWPKEGILSGACDRKYGLCPFFVACSVKEEQSKAILSREFKVQKFNPLNYSGL